MVQALSANGTDQALRERILPGALRRGLDLFDAEGGDLVEGRAAMLQSMVRRPGVGAESLAASPASVSTTLPELGLVEAVAEDASGSRFSRQRAFPVCATQTLHCSWTGQP